MNRKTLLLTPIIFIFLFCPKNDLPEILPPPSNLKVSFTVADDNSGNVEFSMVAENATQYDIDLGNGVIKSTKENTYNYQYLSSGTYEVNIVAKNSSGILAKSLSVTVTTSDAPLWSDEFDYTGNLDPAKWNYEIGNGNNGWGNAEVQYYTNRSVNATVSDGTLKINALKESYNGFNYTSSRITTQNKFSRKYGRIEARIKLPTGVGVWPAFWMLGDNISTIGWPSCGEIDIMEMVGKEQNKIFASLHYPGHSGGEGTINTTINPTASTAFHVYSLKWTETSISFYIDNQRFAQANNNGSLPFNLPFFIILNVAMGGTFGGPVDSNFTQSTMEVDYVRVYAE